MCRVATRIVQLLVRPPWRPRFVVSGAATCCIRAVLSLAARPPFGVRLCLMYRPFETRIPLRGPLGARLRSLQNWGAHVLVQSRHTYLLEEHTQWGTVVFSGPPRVLSALLCQRWSLPSSSLSSFVCVIACRLLV